jgi:membrane-bound lytic murein transglycosylase D
MKKSIMPLFTLITVSIFSLLLSACSSEDISKNNTQLETKSRKKTFTASPKKEKDLWNEIRLTLEVTSECRRPAVKKQMDWYIAHPDYVNQIGLHAKPYLHYIYKQVQNRDIPTLLVLLPAIESAYDPVAYSGVGAAGLWQFMPSTASGFGIKQNWWYDGRRDLVTSTRAALDYLTYLHSYFNDDWLLAIAAYDAGEGAVEQALKHISKNDDSNTSSYWGLSLPGETKHYIPQVLGLACAIKYADDYDLDLPYIPNSPYLVSVDVGSQIDLKKAAQMAQIPLATLYHLNPGFNRWATDPAGPFRLLLPVDKADDFKTALANRNEKPPLSTQAPSSQAMAQTKQTVITHPPSQVGLIGEKRYFNLTQKSDLAAPPSLQAKSEAKPEVKPTASTAFGSTAQAVKQPVVTETISVTTDTKPLTVDLRKNQPVKIIHTIKANQSLWDIAKQYNVKVSDIAHWNNLGKNNLIHPNQNLILWIIVK